MPYFPGVAPLPDGDAGGYWASWLLRALHGAAVRALRWRAARGPVP